MITAWDVYWVMQLSSIKVMLSIATIVIGIAFLALFGAGVAAKHDAREWPSISEGKYELGLARQAAAKRLLAPGIVLWLLSIFTPSSQTAAAMILVPALTSDQVVEPVAAEAKELYALAKQALANVAQPKPEPPKEEAK